MYQVAQIPAAVIGGASGEFWGVSRQTRDSSTAPYYAQIFVICRTRADAEAIAAKYNTP